jgi:acetyl-CoA acyltransferase
MRDAVIVSAVRTAVGKAPKGTLRDVRPDEMGATVIKEAIARAEGVEASEIEDVIMGCAMPEAEQGMNVARAAAIRAGLPVETSAMTINRFCSSGLQSIAIAADRIRTGSADVIVAGGLETMSMIPMGGHIIRPNPYLVEHYPDFYLNMGLATENVARKYEVSREEQDEFALRSQQRAAAAIDGGGFDAEIVAVETKSKRGETTSFTRDEHPRADTTAQTLKKLPPVFAKDGTVTAGNSSGITDGAAAVVLMSEEALKAARGAGEPQARIVDYEFAGVAPEIMGIGPVPAIRALLARQKLQLSDIDLVELNEAFAAQVIACDRELKFDPARLNVNGGAIALGHPIGCTGVRITTTLLYEMQKRGARRGLATLCISGGMGIALLLERV